MIATKGSISQGLAILLWLLILPFNSSAGETNNSKIQELNQKVRTNKNDLIQQKTLLEKNSVHLYKTLIKLDQLDSQSVKYSDQLRMQGGKFESIESRMKNSYKDQLLNTVNASGFWLFLATLLVFLAPVGFIIFESGQIKNTELSAAGVKNLLAWALAFLVYFTLGFGLMYGESGSGLMGSTLIFLFAPDASVFFSSQLLHTMSPGGFLFFQLAFAMVAVLIVSTALYNHLSILTYAFVAACMAGMVYPVFGHWAWSSHLVVDNIGWLEELGFIDFAGATVIHSLAAWFSLVWAFGIKPPPKRIKTEADKPTKPSANAFVLSVIGVFILWFTWVGMIAGSHLQYDSAVAILVLKMSLSGAAAGISAALLGGLWGSQDAVSMKIIGGVIGGFVAISAACDMVQPIEAIIIGAGAGIIYPLSCGLLKYTLLRKSYQIKAAGIIAAHGFCGVWGTLSVALFGADGIGYELDKDQFMIQLKGVAVAFGFAIIAAYMCLIIYRIFAVMGSAANKPA